MIYGGNGRKAVLTPGMNVVGHTHARKSCLVLVASGGSLLEREGKRTLAQWLLPCVGCYGGFAARERGKRTLAQWLLPCVGCYGGFAARERRETYRGRLDSGDSLNVCIGMDVLIRINLYHEMTPKHRSYNGALVPLLLSGWGGLLVFGRNLQCQPVRGANTREECHWSHACKSFKRRKGVTLNGNPRV
jgi:hypothetical protein